MSPTRRAAFLEALQPWARRIRGERRTLHDGSVIDIEVDRPVLHDHHALNEMRINALDVDPNVRVRFFASYDT